MMSVVLAGVGALCWWWIVARIFGAIKPEPSELKG